MSVTSGERASNQDSISWKKKKEKNGWDFGKWWWFRSGISVWRIRWPTTLIALADEFRNFCSNCINYFEHRSGVRAAFSNKTFQFRWNVCVFTVHCSHNRRARDIKILLPIPPQHFNFVEDLFVTAHGIPVFCVCRISLPASKCIRVLLCLSDN